MSDGPEIVIGLHVGSSYDDDGHLGFQCDTHGKNAGCPAGELQTPFGFTCRGLDPVNDADGNPIAPQTGQNLSIWSGNELHGWPSQHPLVTPKLPMLTPGSSAQYGATGSFHLIDGESGDQTIYVPYAGGTKAHVFQISASGEHITLRHSSGAGLSLTGDNALMNGPDGSTFVELKSGGTLILNGNVQITGGLGVQGMLSIGPAPAIPLLTAAFTPSTLVMTTG